MALGAARMVAASFGTSALGTTATAVVSGFAGGFAGDQSGQLAAMAVGVQAPAEYSLLRSVYAGGFGAGVSGLVAGAGAARQAWVASRLAAANRSLTILNPHFAPRNAAWTLGPAPRGRMIEQAWGHNLPNAFKTFDRFDNGVATSIKSFNLDLPSFAKPNGVWNAGRKAIDAAINFEGYALLGVRITPQMIQQRAVRIAIPRAPSSAQASEFLRLQQYGAYNGISVTWEVF